MQNYQFEYVNEKKNWILLVSVPLVMLLSILFVIWLQIDYLIPLALVPMLFLFTKYAVEKGSADIGDTYSVFSLHNTTIQVDYEQIESYSMLYYQGIYLKVKLKNGKKLKLSANRNICSNESLQRVCDMFFVYVYKYEQEKGIKIARAKTFLESLWIKWVVLAMFSVSALVIIISILQGKLPPAPLFVSLGTSLALWAGIQNTSKMRQKE